MDDIFGKKSDWEILLDKAKKGDKDSIFDVGYEYMTQKNYDTAISYFKQIENDFHEASYNIALSLFMVNNTEKFEEAVHYYEKAFAMGNLASACELTKLHALGLGAKKDFEKAMYYFSIILRNNYDKCIEKALFAFADGFDNYGTTLDYPVFIPLNFNGVELEYKYIKEYSFSRNLSYEVKQQSLIEFKGRIR